MTLQVRAYLQPSGFKLMFTSGNLPFKCPAQIRQPSSCDELPSPHFLAAAAARDRRCSSSPRPKQMAEVHDLPGLCGVPRGRCLGCCRSGRARRQPGCSSGSAAATPQMSRVVAKRAVIRLSQDCSIALDPNCENARQAVLQP